MALWLVRSGRQGQYEQKFMEENRIYLTWRRLTKDLSQLKDKNSLQELLVQTYPDQKPNTIRNWIGQMWIIAKEMKVGDWVVFPSKKKSAIHFAEIMSDYTYLPSNPDPFLHYRDVKWIATDIPRSNFDQDLLYSFGAAMTICQIKRNNAENRIKAMAKNGWKPEPVGRGGKISPPGGDGEIDLADMEQLAKDEIAKHINRKYKGHGMARLVEAVLQAQGYQTYLSPEGPDRGVDILAAPGPLGFGQPRICVQVKSSDSPIDRPTLNQLIGTMQNVNADQGLLVSWGGFKSSIDKEVPKQFFKVRMWDQSSIIEELLDNYDKLDEDLKAELPLKRIWTLALPEDDESGSE